MHDLVIRGGLIVDGTGAPGRAARRQHAAIIEAVGAGGPTSP